MFWHKHAGNDIHVAAVTHDPAMLQMSCKDVSNSCLNSHLLGIPKKDFAIFKLG